MDDRITELETRLVFQDDVIEKLNEVVTNQQQQLDKITRELLDLRAQIKSLEPSNVATDKEETPPPHY